MSLSIKKLQDLLLKKGIICDKYFIMNGTCFYIEVFFINTSETFLLYIPSKYEIVVKDIPNIFKINTIEMKVSDEMVDDYGIENTEEAEQIHISDNEENAEEQLEKNYKNNLTIKDISSDDLYTIKSIYRQLRRLKGSVENIKYKLAISFKNYICAIRRDNSIDCFEIKRYKKQSVKRLFVIVDLEMFYEKGDKISEEIVTVRESIYNILQKNQGMHVRFINKIMENKSDILLIPEKAEYKKEEYMSMLQELKIMLKKVLDKENEILDKINEIDIQNNGDTLENDINRAHKKSQLEKELEHVFILKNELTKNIASLREKMENSILNIDKIMFDNSVIFDAMIKNFALLKDFC